MVDAAKHLDIVTKESIKRLLSHRYKPSLLNTIKKIKAMNVSEASLEDITKLQQDIKIDELDYEPKTLSSVLVMNKIDLITNKRRLKTLQEELEDLGSFDKVFHVSCETGYGLDHLKAYLKEQSFRRPWRYHPEVHSTRPELEKCEDVLTQIIYNRFYKEFPYNTIVTLTGWVPMTNGEIKANFQVEVKYDMNIAMFVGKGGRVIKELREELNKALTTLYQMPVRSNIFVVQRRKGVKMETLNNFGTQTF